MSLKHKLAALQRGFSGVFGVAARDLGSGREIARNADATYPAASCIKILGLSPLALHRPIAFDVETPLAEGTPRAFCDLLTRLARREVVSPTASETMIEIMKRQHYTDIIGRYLPYDRSSMDEDPEGQLAIATKSSSVRGVRNDVGIVFPPGRAPYAIALMSRDCADDRYWADNEAKLTLARVSRVVYEAFVSGHSQGEESRSSLLPR